MHRGQQATLPKLFKNAEKKKWTRNKHSEIIKPVIGGKIVDI